MTMIFSLIEQIINPNFVNHITDGVGAAQVLSLHYFKYKLCEKGNAQTVFKYI